MALERVSARGDTGIHPMEATVPDRNLAERGARWEHTPRVVNSRAYLPHWTLIALLSPLLLNACGEEVVEETGMVVVNEIMASPPDDRPDWIELMALGEELVDLSRFTLVDGGRSHEPEQLPDVMLEPGELLVLAASRDPDEDEPFRFTFQLGRSDSLTVFRDGLEIDEVEWDEEDVPDGASWGRLPDGEGPLRALSPTPNEPNIAHREVECRPRIVSEETEGDEVFVTEGETLTVVFDCASGLDRSEFEATVNPLPPGARFDDESWELTWETSLTDAGHHEVALAVHPVDLGDWQIEEETVELWVADGHDDPLNVPVDPVEYTEEWGLPVIHLEPSEELSQCHVPATVTFMGRSYEAEMKIRGGISVRYPKNSFTVRFDEDDLDADVLGLGDEDHLVLITTFDDNSYVRQMLAYDLWAEMAEHWGEQRFTPRTSFVVVYLDGEYHGLYIACDRIDDHFMNEMGFDDEANLYKSVNHNANFYRTRDGGADKGTLHEGYEKKEGEPVCEPAQCGEEEECEEGAFFDLEALVAFSADSDHETFWAEAHEWMNVDEFMDWYLFVYFTMAGDSIGKNAYLYNQPDQWEFRYIPWDFNDSWGQNYLTVRVATDFTRNARRFNGIFAHFLDHPEAAEVLWSRFRDLRDRGPFRAAWLQARIDDYYEAMERSAQRDWDRWRGEHIEHFSEWREEPTEFDEEQEYLREWITGRGVWAREQ